MSSKNTEQQLRAVATFAGSDLEEDKTGDELFAGARWILNNSRAAAYGPELLEALKLLMDDYLECYQSNTDGQYGRTPGTSPWRRAVKVRRLVEGKPKDGRRGTRSDTDKE